MSSNGIKKRLQVSTLLLALILLISEFNMPRTPFVGGNWKSNGTTASVAELVNGLNNAENWPAEDKVEVVVSPTFLHVPYTVANLKRGTVAGQNCHLQGNGAFTGEISAEQLVDIGAKWVVLGHSERRHGQSATESSAVVGAKTKRAIEHGLKVILCVGETLEERDANKTMDVVIEQLSGGLVENCTVGNVVIAYEPVWAIGTGKVATPEQAQDVHASIRKWLVENRGADFAAGARIIYGGSVKPGNAAELGTKEDVDGFLVGGASLKAADFAAIVSAMDS